MSLWGLMLWFVTVPCLVAVANEPDGTVATDNRDNDRVAKGRHGHASHWFNEWYIG